MADPAAGSRWGFLALAGALSFCCIGLAALAGGAAISGGAVSGSMVAGGAIRSLGGLLVTGLATAIPIVIIGIVLHRRARHQ